jgi:hypothetical protein
MTIRKILMAAAAWRSALLAKADLVCHRHIGLSTFTSQNAADRKAGTA